MMAILDKNAYGNSAKSDDLVEIPVEFRDNSKVLFGLNNFHRGFGQKAAHEVVRISLVPSD